jgi:hypothetical protein
MPQAYHASSFSEAIITRDAAEAATRADHVRKGTMEVEELSASHAINALL